MQGKCPCRVQVLDEPCPKSAPSDTFAPENAPKLGWKPAWDNARFLEHIDDEVEAVLELGQAKSSMKGSLRGAGDK